MTDFDWTDPKHWPAKKARMEDKQTPRQLMQVPDGWPDAVHPETVEHLPASFTGEYDRRKADRRAVAALAFPVRRFAWLMAMAWLGGVGSGVLLLALLMETRVADPFGRALVGLVTAVGGITVAALLDLKSRRGQ